TVTSPAGSAGQVDVTVTTPAGTSPIVAADHFPYDGPPAVSALTPNAGTTAGGTSVTITGTGFLSTTPTTGVKFGLTQATSFVVTDDSHIAAVSPAFSAGRIDVTVPSPSGTSALTPADYYTYDATPTVTALNPAA